MNDLDKPEAQGLGMLRSAPLSTILLGTNAVVFLACVLRSRDARALFRMPESVILWFGANRAPHVWVDYRFETLLTSAFLHFSVIHLLFNLLALRQVGPFLEKAVGPARYFPLYVVSGIVASAASAGEAWIRHAPRVSAGASGAICGLLGAALVFGYRTQGIRGPLTMALARWLGLVVLMGLFLHGVDHAAHVGGALSGGAIAFLWRRGATYTPLMKRSIVVTSAAVSVAAFLVLFARQTADPWLLLDGEERLELAQRFAFSGNCSRALEAAERAVKLEPGARLSPAYLDVERRCRPSPL